MSGTSVHINEASDKRNRNECVKEFNTAVFWLLRLLEERDKTSRDPSRVIGLMQVARRIDHELVITGTGPYLHKYSEMINDRNEDLFTIEKLQTELDASTVPPEQKQTQLALSMFNTIHNCKRQLSTKEREQIWEKIDFLLDTYYAYCIRCSIDKKK